MNRIRKLETVSLGTIVQSNYNAKFFGRLVKVISRKDTNPLWVVESICTFDGRPYRKTFTKTYDASWFVIVESLPARWHTG